VKKKRSQSLNHLLLSVCTTSILLITLSACSLPLALGGSAASTPTVAATATHQSTSQPTISVTNQATIPAIVATAIPTVIASTNLVGPNLITNGDAETGPGSPDDGSLVTIPGWIRVGSLNVMNYQSSASSYITTTDPGPTNRGKHYFYGGTEANSPTGTTNTATGLLQALNVSAASPLLATNQVKFTLSAYLGGYSSQNDNARLTVQFLTTSRAVLGSASLGPVLATDRNNTTGLIFRSTSGTIPANTAIITITLTMIKTDGSDNDASADNLSLIVHS
jgi:hypothetical protein